MIIPNTVSSALSMRPQNPTKPKTKPTATPTTGNFGSPSGTQVLVIDYDVPAKAAAFKCTITGTALTSMVLVHGPDVEHVSGAKVTMAWVPEHHDRLKDGTDIAQGAIGGTQLSTSAITLGYAARTSAFTTTNTSATQITDLSVNVTIPSGGRRIKITVYAGRLLNQTANKRSSITIWDGAVGSGTQLQETAFISTAAYQMTPATAIAIVSPPAGAKTYNAGLHTESGGTASVEGTGTTAPAFILVEAI